MPLLETAGSSAARGFGLTANYTVPRQPNFFTANSITYIDAGISSSYSGSGTAINDISGNGFGATLVNGTSFNSSGLASSWSFDGANDYIQFGTGFGQSFASGMTIVGVLDWNTNQAWCRWFDFGNGSASNNILYGRPANLQFEIYQASAMAGAIGLVAAPSGMGFYAVKVNGTEAKIWINSTMYTYPYTILPNTISRNSNFLGRSNWPDAYFNGRQAAFAMWNTALKDDDINAMYYYYKNRYSLP